MFFFQLRVKLTLVSLAFEFPFVVLLPDALDIDEVEFPAKLRDDKGFKACVILFDERFTLLILMALFGFEPLPLLPFPVLFPLFKLLPV